MTQTQGAFTDRMGSSSVKNGNSFPDTQSEIVKASNPILDFFQVEKENEKLQQVLYEI